MIRSIALFALVTLAIPLQAQEKPLPDAPKPKPCVHFNKKIFVAGVTLLAAAKTADAITTRHVLNRGAGRMIRFLAAIHRRQSKQELI